MAILYSLCGDVSYKFYKHKIGIGINKKLLLTKKKKDTYRFCSRVYFSYDTCINLSYGINNILIDEKVCDEPKLKFKYY
ncbi:hypothetical protein NT98_5763 (plasmid) [Bacillus cereus]|nr:hypothetical protein NT98_5763 [Bacillus cereus]AJI08088.1 hypothetical protein AQ16_5621 [Bacillus cereus G9241]